MDASNTAAAVSSSSRETDSVVVKTKSLILFFRSTPPTINGEGFIAQKGDYLSEKKLALYGHTHPSPQKMYRIDKNWAHTYTKHGEWARDQTVFLTTSHHMDREPYRELTKYTCTAMNFCFSLEKLRTRPGVFILYSCDDLQHVVECMCDLGRLELFIWFFETFFKKDTYPWEVKCTHWFIEQAEKKGYWHMSAHMRSALLKQKQTYIESMIRPELHAKGIVNDDFEAALLICQSWSNGDYEPGRYSILHYMPGGPYALERAHTKQAFEPTEEEQELFRYFCISQEKQYSLEWAQKKGWCLVPSLQVLITDSIRKRVDPAIQARCTLPKAVFTVDEAKHMLQLHKQHQDTNCTGYFPSTKRPALVAEITGSDARNVRIRLYDLECGVNTDIEFNLSKEKLREHIMDSDLIE